MRINKNFLKQKNLNDLKNLIFNEDFPWRIRNKMANSDKNIWFTYSFLNNFTSKSENFNLFIAPILKKLKCKFPIQIRANMTLNKLYDKSGWHTDYNFKSTTAILYLNTCNGGTEFKIKNKIKFVKAEENKIVIFPTNIEHRGCSSSDVDMRYIINFNYF